MATQPNRVPALAHTSQLDSPYCSDPNCEYCKDLRVAQEQIKNGYPVTPSTKVLPSAKGWHGNA